MMIIPGLSVYWRSETSLSIGLDSRTGVLIDDLPKAELCFIDRLTQPVVDLDIRRLGRKFALPVKRQDEIIAMLQTAGVLVDDVPPLPIAPPIYALANRFLLAARTLISE